MSDVPRPGQPLPGVTADDVRRAVEAAMAQLTAPAGEPPSGAPDDSRPSAFVVMPFGVRPLQVVYDKVVRPVLERCGVTCVRGDDMAGSKVVMDEVLGGIEAADLVIADLTGTNANVFYEVGYAHAKAKQVLLLTRRLGEVPFDLSGRRIQPYTYSAPGVLDLTEKLESHVLQMLGRR